MTTEKIKKENKMKCGSHDILMENMRDLKKGQAQLYDLDREKSKQLGAIEISVTKVQDSTAAGFARIEAQNAQIMKAIRANKNLSRQRWTPKAVIALVGTLFGSGSIGYAIAVFILGRLPK